MIASALSADAHASREQMVSTNYVIMAGTSMATPFITGVVALLLERDPTMDAKDVKALLLAHSAIPGRPGGTFDAKWGFGLLNTLGL
jgi:subtilisin family serine protease